MSAIRSRVGTRGVGGGFSVHVSFILAVSVFLFAVAVVAVGVSAQLLTKTERECAEDEALVQTTLTKFIFTLLTGACDISAGWEHTCSDNCQAAVVDIALTSEGCLGYSTFGDAVFDQIRATAAAAGVGAQVPSAQVMNMTELVRWGVEYCGISLLTGEAQDASCANVPSYTALAGTVDGLPMSAMDDDGTYKEWLRCLIPIEPPLEAGQHIKLTVDELDLTQGDILTIYAAKDTNSMPLTVLTGDTPPFTPIYSPDGADVLLLAFESDSALNTGTGFKVSYEVSDDDIDAMTGCNDPLATNYDATAVIPKLTACEYDFDDGSLLFTGNSGHVDVPDADVASHLPTRDITMAAWVKINDRQVSAYTSYISHLQDDYTVESGFALGMLNIGDLLSHSCAVFTSVHEGSQGTPDGYVFSTDGASDVVFGEWQHVACTFDGLIVSLYVDGELVATSNKQIGDIVYPPEDYSAKHSTSMLTLGAYHDQNDYFTMHGDLDEAMIFNCALPADAIAMASSGRVGTETVASDFSECLWHWFRFNEATGASVVNEGAFSIDGTIIDPLGNQVFRESSSLPA